jgi:hypothetical protein
VGIWLGIVTFGAGFVCYWAADQLAKRQRTRYMIGLLRNHNHRRHSQRRKLYVPMRHSTKLRFQRAARAFRRGNF